MVGRKTGGDLKERPAKSRLGRAAVQRDWQALQRWLKSNGVDASVERLKYLLEPTKADVLRSLDDPHPLARPNDTVFRRILKTAEQAWRIRGERSAEALDAVSNLKGWMDYLGSPRPIGYRAIKIAKTRRAALGLDVQPLQSEGTIKLGDTRKREDAKLKKRFPDLADFRPQHWPAPGRGRPSKDESGRLLNFLKQEYGAKLRTHRDTMRSFIYNYDRRLYDAIHSFERNEDLPGALAMSNREERLTETLKLAAKGLYKKLSNSQKRAARGAVRKAQKRHSGPKI